MSSYPLGQNEADTITSKTGKKLSDITLDEVKRGNVQAEDIKISPEMLKRQGQGGKGSGQSSDWKQIFRELLSLPTYLTR